MMTDVDTYALDSSFREREKYQRRRASWVRWHRKSTARKADRVARGLDPWVGRPTPPPKVARQRGRKLVDLSGQRFSRLTVLALSTRTAGRGQKIYNCRCDCGSEVLVAAKALRSGNTRSCGCLRQEVSRAKAIQQPRNRPGQFLTSALNQAPSGYGAAKRRNGLKES